MTNETRGEVYLQQQIDALKSQVEEMQDKLRDLVTQLSAQGLYHPPG